MNIELETAKLIHKLYPNIVNSSDKDLIKLAKQKQGFNEIYKFLEEFKNRVEALGLLLQNEYKQKN
jgi:hypothetical protein